MQGGWDGGRAAELGVDLGGPQIKAARLPDLAPVCRMTVKVTEEKQRGERVPSAGSQRGGRDSAYQRARVRAAYISGEPTVPWG